MNEEKAREILADAIQPDNAIACLGHYMNWEPGDEHITLDCSFTVDELEAIVWWMHNKIKGKTLT